MNSRGTDGWDIQAVLSTYKLLTSSIPWAPLHMYHLPTAVPAFLQHRQYSSPPLQEQNGDGSGGAEGANPHRKVRFPRLSRARSGEGGGGGGGRSPRASGPVVHEVCAQSMFKARAERAQVCFLSFVGIIDRGARHLSVSCTLSRVRWVFARLLGVVALCL